MVVALQGELMPKNDRLALRLVSSLAHRGDDCRQMSTRTILVIEDEKDLANLVQRRLQQEGFDVIVATDGNSGLRAAKEQNPDLVVLDINMPGLDGLQVCRELRSEPRYAKLPILILSARASAADRVAGLELGADDYLVKPFLPRELVARVNAILRRAGDRLDKPAVICSGDLVIDLNAHQVTHRGQPLSMTAAEFRMLELLASHPGRVFSRDEIIESTPRNDAVTARSVDAHIVGIRKALGPAADCIETVRSVGYRFRRC
jgi:DNA-binding response OmpR family regulator